jgi:hypothetical protein
MGYERKNSFRPTVESAEGRVLAAALTGQAWVDIVNRTDQILNFLLSTDNGASYRPYHVRLHSTFYWHVNRNAPSFDLLLPDGSITNLVTGPTRKLADTYYVASDLSVTGGPRRGRVVGPTGSADPLNNVARFSILNETDFSVVNGTKRPTGKAGFDAKILFSIDGGQTYPISDTIPFTGGKVPTPVTLRYGSKGIIYRIPATPSIQPTPLTEFNRVYDLFSISGMRH